LNLIGPGLGLAFRDRQLRLIDSTTKTVQHKSQGGVINLQIHTPNSLCRYRADTFSTKEPETLAWIDEYGGDGPLYDIGANIGLYSLYYAATKAGSVYSFEPSVFNLKLLAKNIYFNGFDKKIRIIPTPLTDHNDFADFSLSSIDEGGALSSFGVEYGYDGEDLNTIFRYQILGLTLDYLLSTKMINEPPQLIKIDVDGIEHLILAGAVDILKNPNLKSLLIEVNDNFQLQATNVSKLLTSSGFYLEKKRHSEMTAADKFSVTSNQIWCRD
jgi:FkbM family methyltransferase